MGAPVERTDPVGGRFTDGGIVTPEGVVLDFDKAGVVSRALARVVDLGVVGLALAMLSNFLVILTLGSEVLALVAFLVLAFLAIFAYPAVLEATWRGRTVGKMVLGLRVVTTEGAPVHFRHAAIRSMLQVVDILATFGGAAVIAALSSPQGQRLGDMAAGTYVVRERRASSIIAAREVRIPPPFGHSELVSQLDPTPLTIPQRALLRSYLVRVTDMDPAARLLVGTRMAEDVAAQIGADVDPDMHPETWLACVAAAIQAGGRAADEPVSSLPPPTAPAGAPVVAPPPSLADDGWAVPT